MPGTLEQAALTSVTARFAETEPNDFEGKIQDLWSCADDIRQVIQQHVQSGRITPVTGCGTLAVCLAQLFGYAEFSGIMNPSPVSAGLWTEHGNGSTR